MKKIISIAVVIAMLLSSMVVFVSAEDITALNTGFENISFSNGYTGFCIDNLLKGATSGDNFTAADDTSVATNNIDGSDVSQKLKVLFTQHFDTIFIRNEEGEYYIDSLYASSTLPSAIYGMTDNNYIWGASKELVNAVNAYDGPAIPDDGYTLALENGDYVTFHFAVFEPEKNDQQAFFAYKLDVSKEPPAHTHDYSDDWKSDETSHWHECDCGDKVDVEEHDGNTPDCVTESTCEECGKKLADENPDNHTGNTEIRNEKPAEEFEDGYTGDEHCADCGELLEKGTVIPATHEHDYSEDWKSDEDEHWHECDCGDKVDVEEHEGNTPDCVTESTCEECGKKLADTDENNHSGNTEIRNEKPAEEFEDGYTGDEHCADCGELLEKGTVIPATHEHDHSDDWKSDEDEHWHECDCGDQVDVEEHEGNTPDCVTESTCEECGKKLADTDENNHTGNTEIRNEKPAEEFEDGYTGDEHCADCGELLEKGTVIPATHEHDHSDDWKSDDTNHWHECECGDKTAPAKHSYKGGECIFCGAVDANTGIITYEKKIVFIIENGLWADGKKDPIIKNFTITGSAEPEIVMPEGMTPIMGYGNGSWKTVESGTTVTYTYIYTRLESDPIIPGVPTDPENPDGTTGGILDIPLHVVFGKTEGIGWYSVSVDGGKTFHTQFGNSTLEVKYGTELIVKVNDITGDSFNFFVNGEKVKPDENQTIVVTVKGYTLIGAIGYVDEITQTEESVSLFQKIINMIKDFFQKILELFGIKN